MDRLSSGGELSWGHDNHIHLVLCGPLLYYDVPNTCPSLYSEGDGLGRRSSEDVGEIAKRDGGRWRDHYVE